MTVPSSWSGPQWHVLTLVVDRAAAESFADALRDRLGLEPVQLDRPGAVHSWLELYFAEVSDAQDKEALLRPEPEVLATHVRRCDSRDWHTFWQTHFKPHPVGRRLFISPVWDKPDTVPDGRGLLQIVPGLSFGTGDHFTTRFCLEMLDTLTAPPQTCRTLWDVGCGSGICGVAGALLGVDHVVGTDNDPICLVQAAENAALNGVAEKTTWMEQDILTERLADPTPRYEVVCANLFSSLLLQAAPRLWSAADRFLILSGIREFEADAVAETFIRLGATEMVRDGDGDWAGLLFRKEPT